MKNFREIIERLGEIDHMLGIERDGEFADG
jgi:hypothetical protein